jgi:hypothetical protein
MESGATDVLPEKVSSMTIGPVYDSTHVAPRPRQGPSRLAQWAVGAAWAAVGIMVIGYLVFGVALALNGPDAVEDTWVGALGAVALYGALVSALLGFVAGVVVLVSHERWRWLWVPLTVLPALVGLGLLVEGFLIE